MLRKCLEVIHVPEPDFVNPQISHSSQDEPWTPSAKKVYVSWILAGQACCSFFREISISLQQQGKLSIACSSWAVAGSGCISGVPNAKKVWRTDSARKHQSFPSSFQTYYFLLFLGSIHCSFKNKGPILWAAQWSILNSWAVFVYIQSQALPFAINRHWHHAEKHRGDCHITVYSFLTWRKGVEIDYLQLSQCWEGPREERWRQAYKSKDSWGSSEWYMGARMEESTFSYTKKNKHANLFNKCLLTEHNLWCVPDSVLSTWIQQWT